MFQRGIVFAALVAALAGLSTGCTDLGDPVQPEPEAELSSSTLGFGTVVVGQSTTRTLALRNRGTGTLDGNAVLSGDGYTFESGGGPFTVAPGQVRNIVVRFTPGAVGSYPGRLALGADAPEVSLSGSGALQTPGAQCLVLPASIDFGAHDPGETVSEGFQVYSVGTAPLLIDVVANAPEVQVMAGGGAATLDPGSTRSVVVAFRAQASGLATGSVAVGPGCPEVTFRGVGVTVSFTNDVRPIFSAHACLNCHYFYSPQYIVDVPTVYGAPYVKPFDPAQSVIYGKITNSGQYGGLMPPGGPQMPQKQSDVIKTWILEGALDN